MSSVEVTLKSNASALVRNFTRPQISMSGNVINNFSSLECWVITKTNFTASPWPPIHFIALAMKWIWGILVLSL